VINKFLIHDSRKTSERVFLILRHPIYFIILIFLLVSNWNQSDLKVICFMVVLLTNSAGNIARDNRRRRRTEPPKVVEEKKLHNERGEKKKMCINVFLCARDEYWLMTRSVNANGLLRVSRCDNTGNPVNKRKSIQVIPRVALPLITTTLNLNLQTLKRTGLRVP
jgi:hypothetical protein